MAPLLDTMNRRLPEMIDWIQGLVEIESPTRDKPGVDRAADYVAARVAGLGRLQRLPVEEYGDCLRIEFDLPGGSKQGRILGLGHLDTVWPLGTLESMPFLKRDGRLHGPGVFDMKAGVAYFIFAVEALRELDVAVPKRFVLQLNSEEEIGSPVSRRFTREAALPSDAVLVAEPSAGLDGRLKTARKGGGGFRIAVRGKAAHAGLDFFSGASAVVELARQIERIASWTDPATGVTINPGVIRGGTEPNVVAERAEVDVDVRVPRADQARELEERFFALRPFDERTEVKVEGGIRRPPLERNEGVVRLFEHARKLSAEMGVELEEASVGGGSDGCLTAALGVPTLDGLGAVGEGAHAANESILIERMADRAALIAKLIAAL